jgi:hypothetical protein
MVHWVRYQRRRKEIAFRNAGIPSLQHLLRACAASAAALAKFLHSFHLLEFSHGSKKLLPLSANATK